MGRDSLLCPDGLLRGTHWWAIASVQVPPPPTMGKASWVGPRPRPLSLTGIPWECWKICNCWHTNPYKPWLGFVCFLFICTVSLVFTVHRASCGCAGLGSEGTGSSRCRWCNHSGLRHFCYIHIPLKSTIMVAFSLIEDIPERWTATVIAPFYLKIWIWDWSLWSYEITVNMLFSPFMHETYMQQWLLQCIFSLNLSEPSARKYSSPSTILLIGIMHKKICFRV